MQKHITHEKKLLVIGEYHLFHLFHTLGWRKGSLDYMFDVCRTEKDVWDKIDILKQRYPNLQVIDERKRK